MSKKEHLLLCVTTIALLSIGGIALWKLHEMKQALVNDYPPMNIWHGILWLAVAGQVALSSAIRSLAKKPLQLSSESGANLSPSQEFPPSIR